MRNIVTIHIKAYVRENPSVQAWALSVVSYVSRVAHTQLDRAVMGLDSLSSLLGGGWRKCEAAPKHGIPPHVSRTATKKTDCAASCEKPRTPRNKRKKERTRVPLLLGAVQHGDMDPDRFLALARCLRRCRSTPDLSFTAVSLLSKVWKKGKHAASFSLKRTVLQPSATAEEPTAITVVIRTLFQLQSQLRIHRSNLCTQLLCVAHVETLRCRRTPEKHLKTQSRLNYFLPKHTANLLLRTHAPTNQRV